MPEQSVCFAEPGTLAATEISGHGGLFVEDLFGPLARFGGAILRREEGCVVVVGFRDRRNFGDALE